MSKRSQICCAGGVDRLPERLPREVSTGSLNKTLLSVEPGVV